MEWYLRLLNTSKIQRRVVLISNRISIISKEWYQRWCINGGMDQCMRGDSWDMYKRTRLEDQIVTTWGTSIAGIHSLPWRTNPGSS